MSTQKYTPLCSMGLTPRKVYLGLQPVWFSSLSLRRCKTLVFAVHLVLSNLKMKPGDSIKVKGKVTPEAKSFSINLGQDESDLILHFNPRFDSDGDNRIIVCNSMACGEWGEELRESEFPFQQGEETKICVSFTPKEVMVKLHDDQEIRFPNRQQVESAEFFSVNGDFRIKSVKMN